MFEAAEDQAREAAVLAQQTAQKGGFAVHQQQGQVLAALQHASSQGSHAITPPTGALNIAEGSDTVSAIGYSSSTGLQLMLQAAVTVGERTDEGNIIQLLVPAWRRLAEAIVQNRKSLFELNPRESEELIAGAYKAEGYEIVILTPRSGDLGRDIIATRQDLGSIRIIDQVKRYAEGQRVTADDVRALLGVLLADPKATKGCVTTTAEFAPGIDHDPIIKPYIPYRLQLRSGEDLVEWLGKALKH
jgi:restriction system protein